MPADPPATRPSDRPSAGRVEPVPESTPPTGRASVGQAESASGQAESADGQTESARETARRRRLADLLGDVLPETTADDRPEPGPETRSDERWYLENRPPHHGG
jgi:hypothetical protein